MEPLSRDLFIDEAIRQARDGIAPSVRGASKAIGASPMAMYRHIKDSDELASAVITTIVRRALNAEKYSIDTPLSMTLPIAANALCSYPGIFTLLNPTFLRLKQPVASVLVPDFEVVVDAQTGAPVPNEMADAVNATLIALVMQPSFEEIIDTMLETIATTPLATA